MMRQPSRKRLGLTPSCNWVRAFTRRTARCHGTTGAGGAGPSLHNSAAIKRFAFEEDDITWIENGGGVMPGFKGQLTAEQIAAVSKYVRTVLGDLKS